MSSLII